MGDEYKVGDRVRVKTGSADGFVQPWRARFESGREGTVTQIGRVWGHVLVTWDRKAGKGAPLQLDMDPRELERVQP